MAIFGIGSEITECLRIARLIERHGELFLQRVFTSREIEFCTARTRSIQHYAAIWAAKKAVLKAIGATTLSGRPWKNIEIRRKPNRRVSVALAGTPRDACESFRIAEIHVTLSFCHTHATAFAIAEIA